MPLSVGKTVQAKEKLSHLIPPLTNRLYQLSQSRAFLEHLTGSKFGEPSVLLVQPCLGLAGGHLHSEQCWAGQEWHQAQRGGVSLSLWHPAWWEGQTSAVGEQQGQCCARSDDKPGALGEHNTAQHGQGKAFAVNVKGKALTAVELA